MKKLLLFLFVMVISVSALLAQAPQKMTYQAVVRNAGNSLVANQNVSARISIVQRSEYGASVYVETHSVTTNANGLMTLEVGEGTPLSSGTFANIDWTNGPFFLKSEIDPAGGNNYSITGLQQLLSVPYALYAAKAGNVPAFAVASTDTGYVISIFQEGSAPQTIVLRQGTPGPQGPPGIQGLQGLQGEPGPAGADGQDGADGRSIVSVTGPSHNGLQDTYTINYSDGTQSTFTVTNGADGQDGRDGEDGEDGQNGQDGRGIVSITGPTHNGLQDTYTINYSDGTQSTFVVTNGAAGAPGAPGTQGDPGPAGRGILSITGPTHSGMQDIYTIVYSDGSSSTFTVTNGAPGADGAPGAQGIPGTNGVSITGVVGPVTNPNNQLQDIYTITYSNGNTSTFTVTNGAPGADGAPGTPGVPGTPGAPGNDGVSITGVTGPVANPDNQLQDIYTITYSNGNTSTFTVTNGTPGADGAPGTPGAPGAPGTPGSPGNDGVSITGVTGPVANPDNQLQDIYTITYSNGNSSTFTVTNGASGADGAPGAPGTPGSPGNDGVSITGVTGPVANPDNQLQDIYTITYSNGNSSTFTVTNGASGADGAPGTPGTPGAPGNDGVSITGVTGPVANPDNQLQDIYTITYSNGNTSTFMVTNGAPGADGTPGQNGQDGNGIDTIIKTNTSGLVDTYTISFTNGTTKDYTVTNGAAGPKGEKGDTGAAGHSATIAVSSDESNIIVTVTDSAGTHQYAIPTTTSGGGVTQQNADWNSESGVTMILNKPTKVSAFTNDAGYITKDSIPTKVSVFTNDAGYLTSYTETDPTVPAWAKEANKPVYNYSEIQNTPDMSSYLTSETDPSVNDATITIQKNGVLVESFTANESTNKTVNIEVPTKTSDLTNDAGFLTADSLTDLTTQLDNQQAAIEGLQNALDSMQQVIEDDHFICGTSTVKDYDGNKYNTVKIGNQCWMKENLRTTHYADGTAIDAGASSSSTTPYRYAPHNDENTVSTYGYLYNWPAVMHGAASSNANPSGVQGICPNGWHVPSDAEWIMMEQTQTTMDLSGFGSHGDHAGRLAGGSGWSSSSNANAPGKMDYADRNASGFSALPAGYYNGNYINFSFHAYFWCATGYTDILAYDRYLVYNTASVYSNVDKKAYGLSVRCVRDKSSVVEQLQNASEQIAAQNESLNEQQQALDNVQQTLDSLQQVVEDNAFICGTSTIKDYDGNVYSTLKLGNQCWMKENLRTTHYSDGTEIPAGSDTSSTIPYRYRPNDSENNVATYGYLYNWAAVMNGAAESYSNPSGVQGICPKGWHLPSRAEFEQLQDYMSGQSEYTCDGVHENTAKALASTTGWNSYYYSTECDPSDQSVYANNASGFSAPPAGFHNGSAGLHFGDEIYLSGTGYYYNDYTGISNGLVFTIYRYMSEPQIEYFDVTYGLSVRCLRDNLSVLEKAINDVQEEIMGDNCGTATVRDYDGNVYNTVKIGNQCWLKENIRTTHYADGTAIPAGSDTSSTIAYRYAPNNDEANVSTYGYLYNWPAMMNGATSNNANPSGIQGICPKGWHVPSNSEWSQLETYVNSQSEYLCYGGNAKALAATTGWESYDFECTPGYQRENNNATGFSVLPTGKYGENGYEDFNRMAIFWSTYLYDGEYSFIRDLWNWSYSLVGNNTIASINCGLSVRCLRDETPSSMGEAINNVQQEMNEQVGYLQQTIDSLQEEMQQELENATFICGSSKARDYDGNEYNTVKIGSQCWLKENIRSTHFADGIEIAAGTDTSSTIAYRYAPNNDESTVPTCGYLYNVNAALRGAPASNAVPSGVQGICPTGWHVPSNAEWVMLRDYVKSQSNYSCGGDQNKIAKALAAASTLWYTTSTACTPGNDVNTNNATGFSALPAGYKQYGNMYLYRGGATCWLTQQYSGDNIIYGQISRDNSQVGIYGVSGDRYTNAYSVRCLRDEMSSTETAIDNMQQNMLQLMQQMIHDSITPLRNQINQQQNTIDSLGIEVSLCTCGLITVSDIDGNEYHTVRIGNQCWMKENLRTTRYADGTLIVLGGSDTSTTTAYRYYPGNHDSNVPTYGYLYNWKAVMGDSSPSNTNPSGVQGICPTGWHVPSDAEWTAMEQTQTAMDVSGLNRRGDHAGRLAGGSSWTSSATDNAPGNMSYVYRNASGFSALPAGAFGSTISSNYYGRYAFFWSATTNLSDRAYDRFIEYDKAGVSKLYINTYMGLSVRCVRD
jgi:uncharacterized protein (TIGR02145 family)